MANASSTPNDRSSGGGAAKPGAGGRARRIAIKLAVAVALLCGLGFAFIRSLKDSVTTPYTIESASMDNWTVAVDSTGGPGDPMLVLQPPSAMARSLFGQVFKRVMESMEVPGAPIIPLLLRREFDRAFSNTTTPESLLAMARAAGLNGAAFRPRCLAHRRVSVAAGTQQIYFVIFDSPAFVSFRQRLAASAGGGAFDPDAQSPLLLVSVSNSTFTRWLPLRADPSSDCVSPVAIEPSPPR